jgi:hypothetical protein
MDRFDVGVRGRNHHPPDGRGPGAPGWRRTSGVASMTNRNPIRRATANIVLPAGCCQRRLERELLAPAAP